MDNKFSILIVDDDKRIAETLEYMLSHEGFTVHWADTGEKALQLAQAERIDLILLDIHLPDMYGFDVCRKLRKIGRRFPIVMMSVENRETDVVRGLKAGANDYITKPFGIDELISRVQVHLHWRQVYSGETEEVKTKFERRPRPKQRRKPAKSEEMPLLTRLAIRNGNPKRKNQATARIEALDRAKIERWNQEFSEEMDEDDNASE